MSTPVLTVLEEDKHAWFAGRTRAILKYLDAEMGPAAPGAERVVLDIGSGAGNMAHHLAHYGTVVGLDYNERPLAVAAQRVSNTPAVLREHQKMVGQPRMMSIRSTPSPAIRLQ